MASMPVTLDTKGKDRAARTLHSMTLISLFLAMNLRSQDSQSLFNGPSALALDSLDVERSTDVERGSNLGRSNLNSSDSLGIEILRR